ncbi:hypothetical protein ACA910_010023 [Epithemia clementina (nom. ined.)]
MKVLFLTIFALCTLSVLQNAVAYYGPTEGKRGKKGMQCMGMMGMMSTRSSGTGGKDGKMYKYDHEEYHPEPYDPETCPYLVTRKCVGDCTERRPVRKLPVEEDEPVRTMEEVSLTYNVPYGTGADRQTFCLVAEPGSYCAMVMATATIAVDGCPIDAGIDMTNEGDGYTFEADEGATIQIDVSILKDDLVLVCIQTGYYAFLLKSGTEKDE